MFRVFKRFNRLFIRKRIRNAVSKYQQTLMTNVQKAVAALQMKQTRGYEASEAQKMALLRDIPPVAGKILWATGIERELEGLTHKMSEVIGKGWVRMVGNEGPKLEKTVKTLVANLNYREIFSTWVADTKLKIDRQSSPDADQSSIFLRPAVDDRTGVRGLHVNFDDAMVTVFKEVRNLTWLAADHGGFPIPSTIRNKADDAATRYPIAVALQSTLRTYEQTRSQVRADQAMLIAKDLHAFRGLVERAFVDKPKHSEWCIKWDMKDPDQMVEWVANLSDQVFDLQQTVEDLKTKLADADRIIASLETCPFEAASFVGLLEQLQAMIDTMSTTGYSHLGAWVHEMDKRIEAILVRRLSKAVPRWVKAFNRRHALPGTAAEAMGEEDEARGGGNSGGNDDGEVVSDPDVAELELAPAVYQVLLQNQELYLMPSLEAARQHWMDSFHNFLGIVCRLLRPRVTNLSLLASGATAAGPQTFAGAVKQVGAATITAAYAAIEAQLGEVSAYVADWLQYQSLWDITVQDVAVLLGNDIAVWTRILQEIKAARSTIDTSSSRKSFGPVVIDYSQVQSKVTIKYDTWQKELQIRFADVVQETIATLHSTLVDAKAKLELAKSRLEATHVDKKNKGALIASVTYIQDMRRDRELQAAQVALVIDAERLLQRQRYQFGSTWMQGTMVKGAHETFDEILSRCGQIMDSQVPQLQKRIREEDEGLTKLVRDVADRWDTQKPLGIGGAADGGSVITLGQSPRAALDVIAGFEAEVKQARSDFERLRKAKAALGLEADGGGGGRAEDELLGGIERELKDLHEVWAALQGGWQVIEDLMDLSWSAVQPHKVRRTLEDLVVQLQKLPARVRSYEAYDRMRGMVKKCQAATLVLADLRSEAIKDRHWRLILDKLQLKSVRLADLTLRTLWGAKLVACKQDLADIVATAQGELALDEFLRLTRETWNGYELELVSYQNKVRLLKGWDMLFGKLESDLSSLSTMKQSPYYKNVREFQEEGNRWEEKLSQVQATFDAWVDVQRRWVYLEGIFFGSADIKAQLPAEFSRFKAVDSEFVQLMRRVSQNSLVLEVMDIENLSRQLERQADLMSRIQKALGEYLERQRAAFSRFYFVGDEDLLEIIGNGKEPRKVVVHLSKMFAALSAVHFDGQSPAAAAEAATEGTPLPAPATLTAMISRDDEDVSFRAAVPLRSQDKPMGVKEWLAGLETEMQQTLATSLALAVPEMHSIIASGDSAAYLGWVDKYPAQIVVLSIQVAWSAGVETALEGGGAKEAVSAVETDLQARLAFMAASVLRDVAPQLRKKYEQIITELVHQRDVSRLLVQQDGECARRGR